MKKIFILLFLVLLTTGCQASYDIEINDSNIKEQITSMVDKITADKDLMALFKSDPVKAIEKVLGVDLPDDVVEKVIDGVKAKMTADKAADALGAIKGLFDK